MESQEQEIAIPQMIGSEKLNNIIIAALKVGADKQEKPYSEIAEMSKISFDNISRNVKFFVSIGIAHSDTSRANFKLTPLGTKYAQALDWGQTANATDALRDCIRDKPLTAKVLGFIGMHQPTKDELVGQIAIFASAPKEGRFITGINGYIDFLLTSKLIVENSEGKIAINKDLEQLKGINEELKDSPQTIGNKSLSGLEKNEDNLKLISNSPETTIMDEVQKQVNLTPHNPTQAKPTQFNTTITINIVVDTKEQTSVENLIKILKTLKGENMS